MNLLRSAGITLLSAALAVGTFFYKGRWDSYDIEEVAESHLLQLEKERLLTEREKKLKFIEDLLERERVLSEKLHCYDAFSHNPFNLDDLCTVDFSTKYLTVDVAIPDDPFVKVFYNNDNVDDIFHLVADAYRKIGVELEFNVVETLDTTVLEPGKRLGVQIMHPLDFSAFIYQRNGFFEYDEELNSNLEGIAFMPESTARVNVSIDSELYLLEANASISDNSIISQDDVLTGMGWSHQPKFSLSHDYYYIKQILNYEKSNLLIYRFDIEDDPQVPNTSWNPALTNENFPFLSFSTNYGNRERASIIVHELGHLLGLYHPESVNDGDVSFAQNNPPNCMRNLIYTQTPTLTYPLGCQFSDAQVERVHSYLSGGRVHELFKIFDFNLSSLVPEIEEGFAKEYLLTPK